MQRLRSVEALEALRQELQANQVVKPLVRVCCGTGCRAAGAEAVVERFAQEIHRRGLPVEVGTSGCQGWCARGPLVTIEPQGWLYLEVSPFDVPALVDLTLGRGNPVERFFYRGAAGPALRREEIPFYQKQKRLILYRCGRIDPTNIFDYIRTGGYAALAKVLTRMTPEEVIAEVKRAGLRGRGGAGFPTGRKWELCRAQKATPKYVICNGDEGDPGAFMDRSVLEGDPHAVLEGMAIAAYAVGDVREGFVYVRAEYPLAVKHLAMAIAQAEQLGLLGHDILGTGFDFHVEIKRGAGAFVCGESTALMYSIEGKRGMPRQTPPRSVEAGLWGKPTVLNNVKTFASVPLILEQGAPWFASLGTERSTGTMVFALTGKVQNTGLVEVPMGITIRELVYDIGGGLPGGRRAKAVQIGGPSGGCLPEALFDIPVDFDSLQSVGGMMGSGGLVVLDETDCMVAVARYFLSFTQQESCGKCPPCRIGTYQMLKILDGIVEGRGRPRDLQHLWDLGHKIKATALCGLGRTAPNPVLTTLQYFRDEYEAHIYRAYCPAGVCHSPGSYRIRQEECIQCGLCQDVCEAEAISESRTGFAIDPEECTGCGRCRTVCPSGAVVVAEQVAL